MAQPLARIRVAGQELSGGAISNNDLVAYVSPSAGVVVAVQDGAGGLQPVARFTADSCLFFRDVLPSPTDTVHLGSPERPFARVDASSVLTGAVGTPTVAGRLRLDAGAVVPGSETTTLGDAASPFAEAWCLETRTNALRSEAPSGGTIALLSDLVPDAPGGASIGSQASPLLDVRAGHVETELVSADRLEPRGAALEVAGTLLPTADQTFDIGADGTRFRDIYLSGNTIHLGDVALKARAGALSVPALAAKEIRIEGGIGERHLDDALRRRLRALESAVTALSLALARR